MWTDLGIEARETIANALIPQECGIEIAPAPSFSREYL
jgi:hypothetical protein